MTPARFRKYARPTPANDTRDIELHREPSLAELLDEPVVQALMARDGVGRDALVELMTSIRPSLAA